ncbi:hypothetical protein JIQ42_06259 [Leishmania sp. Namibia]|uniref:hypothetical protein n=1 Tax=Leishmania sp. Namibia TaxID=2802991 RepID=UPI001B53916E|nr:hypothetical protein JIQ42_06259 [Leishmania sp. Namibia]
MSSRYPFDYGGLSAPPRVDSTRPRGTLSAASSSTTTTSGGVRSISMDSDTVALPQSAALSSMLDTPLASTCRPHVCQQSASRPCGFAAPQSGAGAAAPVRTAWNGLAALPQASADRHVVERAVNAVLCTLICRAGNRASVLALVAYRQGVAPPPPTGKGVSPASRRHELVNARYDRVRGRMRESIVKRAVAVVMAESL